MIETDALIGMTAEIVAAYVGHHSTRPAELPDIIQAVHSSLARLGEPEPVKEPEPELKPAVPIRKSVTDEFIISLEDGRKFKSIKRHLALRGLTPDEYRAKWGLPRDYPMTAPGYAAKRSELAKASGLGASRRKSATSELMSSTALEPVEGAAPTVVPEEVAPAAPKPAAPARRRGRPKKAA